MLAQSTMADLQRELAELENKAQNARHDALAYAAKAKAIRYALKSLDPNGKLRAVS